MSADVLLFALCHKLQSLSAAAFGQVSMSMDSLHTCHGPPSVPLHCFCRKLSMKHHPDKVPQDQKEVATKLFKLLSVAKKQLTS